MSNTETTNVKPVQEKEGIAKYLQRFGFGASDMACNFIWQVLTIYIMMYYTDVAHIPVFYVSFLFLFARIIDGFTDVLMGVIIDKTKTRWGKSRPWFLFAAVPFGLLSILCFAVPTNWGVAGRVVYVYITYMAISIAYTMVNAPISSSLPALTADKEERNILVSYRMVMSSVGSLLITALVAPMVGWIGGENEAKGIFWTMTIFSVVGVFLFFFTFGTIEEVVPPIQEEAPKFKESMRTISKNSHLWVFLGNMCLMWGSYFLFTGVMLYFFAYVVHSPLLMFVAPFLLTLTKICAASAAPALTKPFPKKKHSFMVASGITVIGLVMVFAFALMIPEAKATGEIGNVVDANNKFTGDTVTLVEEIQISSALVWFLIIGVIVMGIGHGWRETVYYSMMPEPMDYGEWQSGINTSGVSASLTGFFCKLILAIAGAIPTFLFGFTDYHSDVRMIGDHNIGDLAVEADGSNIAGVGTSSIQQTDGTIWVLFTCFVILPVITTLISIAIVQFFWTIDDEIDAVREDLNNGLTKENGHANEFIQEVRSARKQKTTSSSDVIEKRAKETITLLKKCKPIKVSACATKVRVTVQDGTKFTDDDIKNAKKMGYFGVVISEDKKNYIQFIAGADSKLISNKIKELLT